MGKAGGSAPAFRRYSRSPADRLQITALNFSGETITGSVRSEHLPGGARLEDMFTGEDLGQVDDLHSFSLRIEPYSGRALVVTPTPR